MSTANSNAALHPVTVDFVLLLQPGRSVSDDGWEEIDAAHIKVWEDAKTQLGTWTYVGKSATVRLTIDWSPVLTRLRQHYRLMSQIYDPSASVETKEQTRFPRRPIRIQCGVTVERASTSTKDPGHLASHHAECFLYDLFLILNITAPGCIGSIKLRQRRPPAPWYTTTEPSLSEFHFDVAYMGNRWEKWPAPKIMPLAEVISWYKRVRNGTDQIPANRAEKVLFALLHVCRADTSLNTIIWLFYGLETFFDTRPGENRRALLNRIALLLSPTDKQRKYLGQKLNDLYEIRSSFVHGGREVVHPMHNERIDKRVDAAFSELLDAAEFGFAVLLTSLQKVVERGCAEISFTETIAEKQLNEIGALQVT